MTSAGKRLALFTIILTGLILLPFGTVTAQGETQGGVFGDFEVSPGERVEIPVEIRNVSELYAVDIEIRFDPDVIQIEDANPNLDGVQPALGTFLDAGLTLFNAVDNGQGILQFVMTQVNPSEPKSGDGVLLILYALGMDEGESDLVVTKLEFSDRFGEAIPVETVDGTVSVSEGAAESQSTAIPVQDPTGMVQVPTQQPTSGPTSAPPTPSPTPAAEESDQVSGETEAAAEPTEEEMQEEFFVPVVESGSPEKVEEAQNGFMLLDYWWIVLIVVLAVIGAAVYLLVTKK